MAKMEIRLDALKEHIDEKIEQYKKWIKECEHVSTTTAIGSIREAATEKAEDCKQMVEWLEDYKKLKMTESGGENADSN